MKGHEVIKIKKVDALRSINVVCNSKQLKLLNDEILVMLTYLS